MLTCGVAVAAGARLLLKPLGFLQTRLVTSASVLRRRCVSALPAARCFGSSSDGPPKRPKTSYMHFAEQQWPLALRQFPEAKVVDLSRKIGQKWREMTPEQKKPFIEASAASREQYNAEMERYRAQLTPAQSAALKEEKREKLAKRKATRKKRELRNLGKPKRPRTALIIFITENYAETKGATMIAKAKTLMDAWKKLSEAEKQVYLQQAEDDKVRYRNEMKAWEEHMTEIGREDLIRRTVSKVKKTASPKRGKKKSRVKTIKTKGSVNPAGSKELDTTAANKATRKSRKAEE
ncbi:transcription factor A, mitochondrial [Scleropages formosus]|uniref:Transcription factor A, mitochondrial n=1 Tax=Scleropages formosus TaxID=113540 RepID=A0A8C9WMP4_SCLFO|nr:transcription factor A, mitochondrial-like [Scleropages formosus]